MAENLRMYTNATNKNWPAILLRLGLAFVFLYAALGSFADPQGWVGYIPVFVKNILAGWTYAFLYLHATLELILALWLLWGKWLKWAAFIAFLDLTAITVFNSLLFDEIFRDVGLALAALSLYFLEKKS